MTALVVVARSLNDVTARDNMKAYFNTSEYKIVSENGQYNGSIIYDENGTAESIELEITHGHEKMTFNGVEALDSRIELLTELRNIVESNGEQKGTISKN